jgi:GT2 family glycosyltransferase
MAPDPKLSVILVTWNRRDDLRRLLESLDRQTVRDQLEVIVIDNASTDDTLAMLRAWPTPLRVHAHPENAGPSIGRNLGLLMARGALCCFIDTDAYLVQEDLLERQIAHLEAHPDVCGSSAAIYWDDACERIWLAGGFFTPYGHYDPSRAKTVFEKPMWLSTCFAVYRTGLLREIGGFDPHYVYGYEDADLGMRARRRSGGYLWVDRDRSVVHAMSESGRGRDWRSLEVMFRYFEYHRHYWIMANEGFGSMLRKMLRAPFDRGGIYAGYLTPLGKRRWLMALLWYPAINLLMSPWWAVIQRRNHLKQLLKQAKNQD